MAMAGGVIATVVLEFKLGEADLHLANMPAMLEETRAFAGFRDIRVFRDETNRDRLMLLEEWESVGHYRAYVAWRTETGAMDSVGAMLAAAPIIDIWPERML
ncbi:putative quinol monooxygenase [Novosphingobium colocasiae]|uniref:ABM domain-containing protein n=1 Tax=Novosphingobium colocasiae TaxID=1256513 RepID=A0A918UJR5_9SPHN|nr:antibiotic biosynthesis monooxygenase [Novosphingobium colocasiae]GGZ16495.1 hypothetical protein GCM10011614_34070 [Novosphingobium colocasiae]